MMFKNSKLTLWILAFITLIMVCLFVLDIYHIRSENKETSRILLEAEKAANEESLAQSVRSFQNTASSELLELDTIAVSDKNLILALEKIESISNRLGLSSEIKAVDELEEGEPRVRITLESTGSWSGIYSLLRAIESLPYRVMLEKSTLSDGELGWQSTITLSLYLFNGNE